MVVQQSWFRSTCFCHVVFFVEGHEHITPATVKLSIRGWNSKNIEYIPIFIIFYLGGCGESVTNIRMVDASSPVKNPPRRQGGLFGSPKTTNENQNRWSKWRILIPEVFFFQDRLFCCCQNDRCLEKHGVGNIPLCVFLLSDPMCWEKCGASQLCARRYLTSSPATVILKLDVLGIKKPRQQWHMKVLWFIRIPYIFFYLVILVVSVILGGGGALQNDIPSDVDGFFSFFFLDFGGSSSLFRLKICWLGANHDELWVGNYVHSEFWLVCR